MYVGVAVALLVIINVGKTFRARRVTCPLDWSSHAKRRGIHLNFGRAMPVMPKTAKDIPRQLTFIIRFPPVNMATITSTIEPGKGTPYT